MRDSPNIVDGGHRPAIGREYDLDEQACLMNRGGPTGCAVAGSQSRTAPSSKPTATRPPSPRNAAQMAGDEEVRSLVRTSPVVASRSLTVPSLPAVRNARPSGRNPLAGLLNDRVADRLPSRRVPQAGYDDCLHITREQGPTIRPEFDPADSRPGSSLPMG